MAALTCSAGDVTKAYKIADQMLEERLNNDYT
jgi:pentatricopeptide repeat protein